MAVHPSCQYYCLHAVHRFRLIWFIYIENHHRASFYVAHLTHSTSHAYIHLNRLNCLKSLKVSLKTVNANGLHSSLFVISKMNTMMRFFVWSQEDEDDDDFLNDKINCRNWNVKWLEWSGKWMVCFIRCWSLFWKEISHTNLALDKCDDSRRNIINIRTQS